MRLIAFGLSLLVAVAMVTAQDPMYMAVMPKELRNGMDYTVDVTLTKAHTSNVNVFVNIHKLEDVTSELAFFDSMFTIQLAAGTTKGSGTVNVPFDLPTGQEYYVHLSFEGLAVKPTYMAVIVYRPALPLFITTDKPVYKPGENVLIRALSCDEYLRPTESDLIIEIKDSEDNSIMKETSKAKPELGSYGKALVDISFQLSDDPILGFYTISLYNDDGYTKTQIEVKEYVLPRYEVQLELDSSYVIENEDNKNTISGKIKGLYSYGEDVKGVASIKIMSGDNKVVWTKSDFDGSSLFTAEVEVSSYHMPWYSDWYSSSSTLQVRAELNERLTENVEFAEATLSIYAKPFAATLVKPLPLLFQGQTDYTFSVELTDPMGGRLTDWDPEKENSHELSNYMLYYKARNDEKFTTVAVTSNPQEVTVKLNTSDTSVFENEVEVYYEYNNKMAGKRISGQHVQGKVAKYYTNSKQTIDVQPVSSDNKAERCFKMTPFQAGDKAFYQVVNNYYPETIQTYSMVDGHCITPEQKHAPKSRIVVYKLVDYTDGKTSGTELLTASTDIDVEWSPEQMVEVEVTSKTGESVVKPGEEVEILISTRGESLVSLKGVDKSVSYMADANDLSVKALKDAVIAFRGFNRQKENPNPNPPMFPMPFLRDPGFKRKKRSTACINSEQYMDPRKMLEEAGLFVSTNLDVKRQDDFSCSDNEFPVYQLMEAIPDGVWMNFDAAASRQDGAGEAANVPVEEVEDTAEEENVREDFPETWLWELLLTNSTGELKVEREAPDTITNWQVSAFGVNNVHGLAVSEIVELTVFQDFFISMNLPYSVVRTEKVKIDILVFNYKSDSLTVTVDLATTDNYTILDSTELQRELTISPGSSTLTRAVVDFTKIGDIPLRATAREVGNPSNVDIVVRELKVKPEGREIDEDDNVQVMMPKDGYEQTFNMSKFFKTEGYVEGSLGMYLFVTGDMMGTFISNLVTKIRLPFGCGEQNIKSLTPSVYIGRYLGMLGRLEPKVEELVKKVCGAGVRKQFNYLHADGSYSAFGDRPNLCACGTAGRKRGSTWLTAYVLSVFSLLSVDDVTYIPFENLKKSFDYIKNNVTYTDCSYQYFVEEGELIHSEMQGDTSSRIGFVAFVTQAIMEYKKAAVKAGYTDSAEEAEALIDGSSSWLKNQKEELLRVKNPYQLAIVACTLARASMTPDATSIELLQALETALQEQNMMMEKPDMMPTEAECMYKPSSGERKTCTSDEQCQNDMQCCKVACGDGKRLCTRRPYKYQQHGSMSSMIETKGYAMMAYLELYRTETNAEQKTEYKKKTDDLKEWLLSQRKSNGFFTSTQDTVVALQALARYAIEFPNMNGGDFSVRAKADGEYVTEAVVVTSDTYTVTTERKLNINGPPTSVSIEVTGSSGTAFVNLAARYNVAKNVSTNPYIIDIEPRKVDGKYFIRTCFNKNPFYSGEAGTMIVNTIESQTGYQISGFEIEDKTSEQLSPSKAEISEEKDEISLYYMVQDDGFTEKRCTHVFYDEKYEVTNRKPKPAVVMDYYNQENNVVALYSVSREYSTEYETTTVTLGASHVQMNVFLLMATSILFVIKGLMKLM